MVNTEETHYACGLKKEDFQTTIDGKKTDLYVLKNAKGNEVAVTNYGGAIVAIMVPDKEGKLQMSFKDMTIYKRLSPHQSPIFQHLLAVMATVLLKVVSS